MMRKCAIALAFAVHQAGAACLHATDSCSHGAAFVRPPLSFPSCRATYAACRAAPPGFSAQLKGLPSTGRGGRSAQNAMPHADDWRLGLKHLAPKLLTPVLLLAISLGFPAASPAELTTEQKVAAQVWAVVDQGFVDRTFNNNDWMKLREKVVKRNYASRDEVYDAISTDLLKPLGDQYTRFIDPAKYEALRNSIVGGKGQDVSGIGVTLSVDKKAQRVKIVDVVEGSPAAQAELERGSLITEVNKVRVDDGKATPEDVAAMVRGPVGSVATVKFVEPGSPDEYEVDIERKKFTVKPVTHGVKGKMGWIKVKQFDTQTAELVKSALEENLSKGVECHVMDLRYAAGPRDCLFKSMYGRDLNRQLRATAGGPQVSCSKAAWKIKAFYI